MSEPQGWVGLTGPRAHLAGHKGQGDPVLSLCGDQQVGGRPRGDTASFRQWGQNSLPLPSPQSPSGGGHLPQSQTAVRFHVQFIKNVVSLSFFPTQFIFAVVADGNQLLGVNTADQGGGRGTFCILTLDLFLVVTSLGPGQGGVRVTTEPSPDAQRCPCRGKSCRTITFEQFKEALEELSKKRFKDKGREEAIREVHRLIEGKAPIISGVTVSMVHRGLWGDCTEALRPGGGLTQAASCPGWR